MGDRQKLLPVVIVLFVVAAAIVGYRIYTTSRTSAAIKQVERIVPPDLAPPGAMGRDYMLKRQREGR